MVERLTDYRASTIDVLDRVLDKGIVIDGWWLLSLGGISLIKVDARIVVASIDTYLKHASVLGRTTPLPWTDLQAVNWHPEAPANRRR
ncbi:MAG: gas vesicle synthesis protein GvpA [Acidobacteria bacterium]|nr:MAG: gas vesicle synthesis protein GvpA [Acidobacteriota bacterium]